MWSCLIMWCGMVAESKSLHMTEARWNWSLRGKIFETRTLHWNCSSISNFKLTKLEWTACGVSVSKSFVPRCKIAILGGFMDFNLSLAQLTVPQEYTVTCSFGKSRRKSMKRRFESIKTAMCEAPLFWDSGANLADCLSS